MGHAPCESSLGVGWKVSAAADVWAIHRAGIHFVAEAA